MRKFTLQISLVSLNVGNSGPKKSAKSDAFHGEKVKGSNREYYLEGSAYLEGRACLEGSVYLAGSAYLEGRR